MYEIHNLEPTQPKICADLNCIPSFLRPGRCYIYEIQSSQNGNSTQSQPELLAMLESSRSAFLYEIWLREGFVLSFILFDPYP